MPAEVFVIETSNGSMQMDVIHFVIEHIDKHARKFALDDKPLLLLLAGKGSQTEYYLLRLVRTMQIEVVQVPNNMFHFIQPNERIVKFVFQRIVRATRDPIQKLSIVSFGDIDFKVLLGVSDYLVITPDIVQHPFEKSDVWPMFYVFVYWAEVACAEQHGDSKEIYRQEIYNDDKMVCDICLLISDDSAVKSV